MRYWPMTALAASPYMAPCFAVEVEAAIKSSAPLSTAALQACHDVAHYTPAVDAPNLVIVNAVAAPPRRTFLRYPTLDEWLRLERNMVAAESMPDGELWHVMNDALH